MNKSFVGIAVVVVGGILLFSTMTPSEEEQATAQTEELDMKVVNEEVSSLIMKVMEGLSDYERVGDIRTSYQQSITIQTSINSTDPNAKKSAQDIQKDVRALLKSEELEFVSNIDSYEVYVESDEGKILNE